MEGVLSGAGGAGESPEAAREEKRAQAALQGELDTARAAHATGDEGAAIGAAARALEGARLTRKPDPRLAETSALMGEIRLTRGENELAEGHLLRARNIWSALLGADDSHCADMQNKLGVCYFRLGRGEDAERSFRSALAAWERRPGAPSAQEATALSNLAEAAKERGALAEAEPLALKALTLKKLTLPAGHPDLVRCHYNLARLYHAMGRAKEAEEHYRTALEGWRGGGEVSQAYATLARRNFSALLRRQGRTDEAARLMAEADSAQASPQNPTR